MGRYVQTLDDFWGDRYMGFLPLLDDSIAASRKLAQSPADLYVYTEIDKVNTLLVELETQTLVNSAAQKDKFLGQQLMYGRVIPDPSVEQQFCQCKIALKQDYLQAKSVYNVQADQ